MNTNRRFAVAAGIIAALALGVVTVFATRASATGVTRASASFTDPSGDTQGASPDITGVTVADDYTTGAISVSVTAAGYSTIAVAQQPSLIVYLDTDRNGSTGSVSGSDYALAAGQDDSGWWYDVYHYDGSTWQEVSASSTMGATHIGDTQTWRVARSDLGGTTGFDFYVTAKTVDANDSMVGHDNAPDNGKWSYALSTSAATTTTTTATTATQAPVKPVIGPPATSGTAVAGKRFTVSFPVSRSDTGEALMKGKMICDPSVQGRVISHAESFTGGTAKLVFTIPKSAKGKLVKVKVTIKVGTQSTTRVANFHVS